MSLESDSFTLRCLQTATGIKFFLLAERGTGQPQLEDLLTGVYKLYSDYVMKNPFYTNDQVIRCGE